MRLAVILLPLYLLACSPVTGLSDSDAGPVDHGAWDKLLQAHVSPDGRVDYRGFIADSLAFNSYLEVLSSNHPNDEWTSDERKAYWINAYNAFTVQLIIRNHPVRSIKELGGAIYKVNTPWDKRFIVIEGKDYDLNNIEHDILRKAWKDPRIHFAINCASVSCPKLRNRAYTADGLDAQLDEAARAFINNPNKNQLNGNSAALSRIFKWFGGDFKKGGSIIGFINRYAEAPLDTDADISFLDYDWNLNE